MIVNSNGQTPLIQHLLCHNCPSFNIVKILVDAYPKSVAFHDKFQSYPLHRAATYDNWEILKFLINLYPDALLKRNVVDRTPREVAKNYGLHDICGKLEEEEIKRFDARDDCSEKSEPA